MLRKINKTVLSLSLLTLIGSWVAVIAVDSLNVWNLGNRLIEGSNRNASLFILLFDEGRPIEFAQWFCLMAASMTTAYISSLEYIRGNVNQHNFFLLFSVLFSIMLIEDAGNMRHRLREIYLSVNVRPELSRLTTLVFFFLVSLIPLWAIVRYGRTFIEPKKVWFIFGAGFLFYAMAATSSAMSELRQLEPFYYSLGEGINAAMFNGRVVYEGVYGHPPGYWITDFLLEETLELLGALLFLWFGYIYHREQTKKEI